MPIDVEAGISVAVIGSFVIRDGLGMRLISDESRYETVYRWIKT